MTQGHHAPAEGQGRAVSEAPEMAADEVAIVGMACIVPGADSPGRFWQNIVGKFDAVSEPTPDWQPEMFADPHRADRVYTARGGYLGELSRFNSARYGIMPSSIEGAEPDQFLAFRCAIEALEDAGYPQIPLSREKTGVIVGRGIFVNRGMYTMYAQGYLVEQVVDLLHRLEPGRSDDELDLIRRELKRHLPPFNAETVPGLTHNVLAGRIANRLDLNGPAYMVDAACASALIAAEQGIRELKTGHCDAVIIGGVQVSTPGMVTKAFCHLEALSKTGRIAPFSAEANGTLLGQGCGMLVLKRRRDAERDGNRIYALLRAVGTSSDGKGSGLLAPSQAGQELAVRRAYAEAGVDPGTVELIEAHGTGIPLGDQTELRTLRACFGARQGSRPTVAVGSVKSMISHLIPASGAASLIKTALAVYHRVLPPMLHAEKANPELKLAESPFYLSTEARPWIHGQAAPRRAGVNAFGFGGINAHAILEAYEPPNEAALPSLERQWPSELVVVSAEDRAGLLTRCRQLEGWLEPASELSLVDVAASLAAERGRSRLAIVAADLADLRKKLAQAQRLLADPARDKIQDRSGIFWYAQPLAAGAADGRATDLGRVACVFPGEGAQYPGMLADLCRHFPAVRHQFDLTDAAFLQSRLGQPLSPLIYPPPECADQAEAELRELGGAVTSVTLASRALWALLEQLQLRPDAIVGHSSGEFGALMAAGVIAPKTEGELIRALAEGAENAAELAHSGLVQPAVLTAVGGADRQAVANVLAAAGGALTVAMDNCPSQLVLSGDDQSTAAALDGLRGKGGLCERLPWGRAYHTPAFAPAVEIMRKYYDRVGLRAPNVELWSCSTAGRFPNDAAGAQKLALQQWSTPVRFRETVEAMYAAGVRVFVEVGPRGNLSAFISDTLARSPHLAVPLDLPRRDGVTQLCRALGQLVAHGVPLDWSVLYERRRPAALDFNAPPPKPARLDPQLELKLPELQVSDEAARQWQAGLARPAASKGLGVEPPAPQPRPQLLPQPAAAMAAELSSPPADGPGRPAVAGPGAAAPATASPSATASPAAIPPTALATPASAAPGNSAGPTAAPIGADRRAAVLAAFQQTMRQFLETQGRVLLRSGQAASASGAAFRPAAQAIAAATAEEPSAATAAEPASPPPQTAGPTARGNATDPPTEVPRAAAPQANAQASPEAPPPAARPRPSSPAPASAASLAGPLPAIAESTAAAVVPTPPRHVSGDADLSVAAVLDEPTLTERLLSIVSDRTGYPADMLDLDANLEADLGIDSIKRVEVIGAFRRAVLPPSQDPADRLMERMTGAKTLRSILATMSEMALGVSSREALGSPVAEAAPSPPGTRRWPYLEHVLLHEPGRRLIAECELDVARHPFLADHTFFGRRLSTVDPTLLALPVMPLAMSLELMTEAAATLRPDLHLAALVDVQTLRWLSFETEARRVRLEATEVDDLRIRVKLSEADREGYSAAISEGIVEFSTTPVELGPAVVPDRAETPAPWAEKLYEWILFHGPAFRGIDRLDRCDPHAVHAWVHEPDPAQLLPTGSQASLVLPASLIDVAFQVPGMVYGNWKPSDPEVHMVYPNSFQRLEVAGRRPPVGTQLEVRSTVEREGQYLHTAFEVVDPEGLVVVRALGRVCQLVDFPTGIHHYSKAPLEVTCSREITDLFLQTPFIEHVTVCEIGHATGPILLNRLWSQALARVILGRSERRVFAGLKLPPSASASWLIGRAVAKDAVRLRLGAGLTMADVAIAPNPDGKPEALLPAGQGRPPAVSLAHKDFAAVAAAADAASVAGVGVDIELLGTMYPGLVDDAFNSHERALIEAAARGAGAPVDQWRLSAWAAKEAVGKALGKGVLGGPRSIEVLAVDAQQGRLSLILKGPMAKAFPRYASAPGHERRLDAFCRIRGPHVIALCVLPADGG